MNKIFKNIIFRQITYLVRIAIVAIPIGIFVTRSTVESEYEIVNNVLIISGSYGADINLADAEITLLENSPLNIVTRTNGSVVVKISKGAHVIDVSGI